jgi:Kef-type K+ transport system membrane component KefB
VPYKEAMVLIGEIGLIALILEAGIELDVAQLRQTGTRAMAIAFTGSFLPVAVGMGIAYTTGNDVKAALAIGAAFAPTSLGVAASALSQGGMINTSVGQLIIAACVVDDIIGLVLLSMFQVLVKPDPKLIEYFIPLISSFGFLLLLGVPAITFLPELIQTKFLTVFPKKHRSLAMFGLLAAMCMAYLPLMNYTKSSYLTGAFLAGATFSQIDGAYDKFMHSSHSIMEWLLRVFFAASIGFQVPLKEFQSPQVVGMGFALWASCVTIKALVAFYVPNFENAEKGAIYNPYKRDLLVTGLSMTCRGEFSFIIAAFALSENLIEADVYASVVFAVLLSAITSPFMLLRCIGYFDGLKKAHLAATNPMNGEGDGTMPLHFRIRLETKNAWGLLEQLQKEINGLNLILVDFRTNHVRGVNPLIYNDIYVRDKKCRCAIPSVREEKANEKALSRVSSSPQLMKSISMKSINEVDDDEDREALYCVMKGIVADEKIEEREMTIQKALYKNLEGLSISELSVEQWNPWDWTTALDAMVLKRNNGKVADLDFFVEIFDKADADGSGDVDADELLEELKEAGMNVTKEGVEAMIAHVDEDGDGKLSREEWTESVNHYLKKKKNCHKIDLRSLVRDSSGNLDIKDGSDSDGSGKISFPIKNEILVPLKGDSLMVGQDIENTTAHYDYYEEVKKS